MTLGDFLFGDDWVFSLLPSSSVVAEVLVNGDKVGAEGTVSAEWAAPDGCLEPGTIS